jgi:hypothetical protein
MTKAQYQNIIKDIEGRYNQGYRLRLNLKDGNWVQGRAELLSSNILIVMDNNTKIPAYVDLGSVVQITVG